MTVTGPKDTHRHFIGLPREGTTETEGGDKWPDVFLSHAADDITTLYVHELDEWNTRTDYWRRYYLQTVDSEESTRLSFDSAVGFLWTGNFGI